MSDLDARQFRRIKECRDHHDSTCPKGKADRVYMNPTAIERHEWEEGDIIAGLVLHSDMTLGSESLRISCPGERAPSEVADMVPILDVEEAARTTKVKPLVPVEH